MYWLPPLVKRYHQPMQIKLQNPPSSSSVSSVANLFVDHLNFKLQKPQPTIIVETFRLLPVKCLMSIL